MTTEEEALGYYLKPEGKRMSSFWAALRDARCATGRNVETGTVVDEAKTGSWLGAIGYLMLLDQIGTAVRRSEAPESPSLRVALPFARHWNGSLHITLKKGKRQFMHYAVLWPTTIASSTITATTGHAT